MNLKNDALKELYDTLTYGPVLSSPYAESPIDRAFKECDEKLSGSATFKVIKELENRCENLERSNKALRDDNDKLSDKAIELAKKNEQLEKDIDICKRSYEMLLAGSMESISEKRKLENEIKDLKKERYAKSKENSTLVSANADLSDRNAKLQRNFDRINHLWTGQIQENMELRSQIANLKKEKEVYETIAKEREDLVKERDGWWSRAMHAEKGYATLQKENTDLSKKVADLQKKGDDLTKKGEDLKKLINSVYGTRSWGPDDFYRDGMHDLWSMMEEVADSTYSERLGCFAGLCDIEDLLEWNLEDFLDEYEKWQERQETDQMRMWLANFCDGQNCHGCPLESNEYKCGCGYSFKKANESDTRIIPDEDIKRYYEKARGCGQYTLKDAKLFATTVEGVNRAISKACEDFCKAVRDADNKITENLRKGGTLEATVEVNKDLLATVCGVKPKEEDHQLDYGDAVRVPWRDYDYMYIGPEGKLIRLFDPKTHAVVLVSVNDNLTYQGCKIILCDEADIRKIWKDKK